MNVTVLGQGYVGLPLAMRAAEAGHQVIGYEPNPARCSRLLSGESYVEDISSARLRQAIDSQGYRATSDPRELKGFDIAVITVPTPLTNRAPDLTCIRDAARALAGYIEPGSTVVLESTTYPGTTRDVLIPLLEEGSGLVAGREFSVGFSPERIDPGNAVWQFENTPKVVSGLTADCLTQVQAFYDTLVEVTVPARGLEEAELAKVFENTFRHVNIALVNELAKLGHLLGIDVGDALDCAATKPFGFMRFTPGPGVGGHCLPIDPVYLSHHVRQQLGETFRFVELAQEVNERQPAYVVERLQNALNRYGKCLKGARILALGLTYKAGTADARESPARSVVDLLTAKGAHCTTADPHLASAPGSAHLTAVTPQDIAAADAVVVLTDHPEFDFHSVRQNASYVLDTRRAVPAGDHIEHL
ncbi:nucleotide sugar dehydrogenase [Streptomyces albipurpureus]|uniref:Nucleotide sugar dehydrogenase n=1 Tax=Streptomyces albipurpureus TaxID=2897419 RepID=A0ABT0UMM1_9ACTN|nr:nucleotide sugar dehydrogenase [Streptomyces sp. CWNU-1]MCM2389581.1 nucleotide sugar dehydrogenase [Streptomyces sp. CWNU-1]